MEEVKQIDKNGRLTLPSKIAEAAEVAGGDFVKVAYDAANNKIIITPLELKEKN